MAEATRVLNFVMRGNTADFTRKWTGASALMNRVGTQAQVVANKMGAMGTMMTTRFTAPILIGLGAGVKAFASFDKAMTESLAIMGNVSDQTRGQMEALAMQMSSQSTFAAKELAEAYFFLASAGLSVKQSMEALPVVTSFAQAGAFDMTTATDLLTDAYSALGPQIQRTGSLMTDMTNLSDILVKANTLANATVQQFSEALTNQAGPAMRAFNIEAEDGVAVLSAYADQGIKGNVAGSMFGRAIRLLAKAATENSTQFERMGVKVFDAQGKFRSFALIAGDLENALEGLEAEQRTVALSTLGFQARTQQAILPLIGASKAIADYNTKLKEAGGITQEVADKQLKAFANRVTMLKNKIVNAFIEIGKAVLPTVEAIMEKVEEWTKGFKRMDAETLRTKVTLLLWVAAIGPILLAGKALIGIVLGIAGAFRILGTVLSFIAAHPAVLALAGIVIGLVAIKKGLDALGAQHERNNSAKVWQDEQKEIAKTHGSLEELKAANRKRWAEDKKGSKAIQNIMDRSVDTQMKIFDLQDLERGTFDDNTVTKIKEKIALLEKAMELEKNAGATAKVFVQSQADIDAQKNFMDAAKKGMFSQLNDEGKINALLKDREALEKKLAVLREKGLDRSAQFFELQEQMLAGELDMRDLIKDRASDIKDKVKKAAKNPFVGAFERGSVEDYKARIGATKKEEQLAVQKRMERELKKQADAVLRGNEFLLEISNTLSNQTDDLKPVTIL